MSHAGGLRRLLGLALSATCIAAATCKDHWVDVWASMPQQVEIYNLPPAPYVSTPAHPPPIPRKRAEPADGRKHRET